MSRIVTNSQWIKFRNLTRHALPFFITKGKMYTKRQYEKNIYVPTSHKFVNRKRYDMEHYQGESVKKPEVLLNEN